MLKKLDSRIDDTFLIEYRKMESIKKFPVGNLFNNNKDCSNNNY